MLASIEVLYEYPGGRTIQFSRSNFVKSSCGGPHPSTAPTIPCRSFPFGASHQNCKYEYPLPISLGTKILSLPMLRISTLTITGRFSRVRSLQCGKVYVNLRLGMDGGLVRLSGVSEYVRYCGRSGEKDAPGRATYEGNENKRHKHTFVRSHGIAVPQASSTVLYHIVAPPVHQVLGSDSHAQNEPGALRLRCR